MVAQSDEKYNGFLMQNKVEIVFSVWYSKCKERHLHEQMPFAEPHSKGGASRGGTYLSVRGAHPGLNRANTTGSPDYLGREVRIDDGF